MIYCLNCGKGIPDQSKFCTFCGTAVAANADQVDVTPQPAQPSQPYVNPVPQQPVQPQNVNPVPPQQQYVNPHPPQQQYVNPQPPVQQYVTAQSTATKNEFYKNIGFWGAVLTFIGFFLPYVSTVEVSFYYLVADLAPDKPELYMYAIFPVCAAALIIQGLTGILPRFLVAIFKVLPALLLALLVIGATQSESSMTFMGNDAETILSNIGIGLYMTVIGTILMLFFKTTKTRVSRV